MRSMLVGLVLAVGLVVLGVLAVFDREADEAPRAPRSA